MTIFIISSLYNVYKKSSDMITDLKRLSRLFHYFAMHKCIVGFFHSGRNLQVVPSLVRFSRVALHKDLGTFISKIIYILFGDVTSNVHFC